MSKATIAALAFLALATTGASAQQFEPLPFVLQPVRATLAADPTPIPSTLEQARAKVRKEPALAFLLSFVLTGAGQAYNGQWGKGALMFGGVVAGGVVATVGAVDCILDALDTTDPRCGTFTVGVLILSGFWIWSVVDAPMTSSKLNKANGLAVEMGPQLLGLTTSARTTRAYSVAPRSKLESSRVGVSMVRLRF